MRNQSTPLSVLIDDYRVAIDAHLRPRTVVGYQKALRELERLLAYNAITPPASRGDLGSPAKETPVTARITSHVPAGGRAVPGILATPAGPCLADFTLDAVARVIARKRQTSASNARLIAAVAKVFSKWLYLTKLTDTHRLETLGVPAFNGRRTAFTDAEFSAILKAINALPNRTRKRDKALVLLAMGSGLRSNEIRTLHPNDLHLERPLSDSWALIRWDTTKSQHERKVRIAQDAAAAIHDYIASARPETDGPTFLTEHAQPYSYFGWTKRIGPIADRLEAQGIHGFTAHRARHQWATMAARTGSTQPELCQEGGWNRGSKVPSVYIDELRFEDIQRKPSPMTAYLRRTA